LLSIRPSGITDLDGIKPVFHISSWLSPRIYLTGSKVFRLERRGCAIFIAFDHPQPASLEFRV
jgi:hypothetical protein